MARIDVDAGDLTCGDSSQADQSPAVLQDLGPKPKGRDATRGVGEYGRAPGIRAPHAAVRAGVGTVCSKLSGFATSSDVYRLSIRLRRSRREPGSLRDQFAVWYPLSAEARRRFVTDGLIVLDTNVLLDLYRMNPETRDDVLVLLRLLDDRLWIPHQVGLEFHRNRLTVVHDQEQTRQKIHAAVTEADSKLKDAIRGIRDHPVIDRAVLSATVEKAFEDIKRYVDQVGNTPVLSMRAALQEDPILDAVTELLEGKVGTPYATEQMEKILIEAKRRIGMKIPPGYADAKKDDDGSGGDYIVWRQTLDEACRRKLPVLFVTNDRKEDWYLRLHGLTVGPRVELVAEMEKEAGVSFYAQPFVCFLENAPTQLSSTMKDATVSEVNRLDEVDRAFSRAEIVSELAERELEQLISLYRLEPDRPSNTRETQDRLTIDIVRLEARQSDLLQRVAELQTELHIAQAVKGQSQRATSNDPRSYVRAIEARLDASSRMLEDVTERLVVLRQERTVRQRAASSGRRADVGLY